MPNNIHSCSACTKTFSSEKVLGYHFTVEHTPNSFQCSACQKMFPSLRILSHHGNAHFRNVHSCNICGDICATKMLLYIHLTVSHKYNGVSTCNLCENTFSRPHHLRMHYKTKHSDSIQSLEQKAELLCVLHSRRVFPDDTCFLYSVLNNEDAHSDHSEAVENVDNDKLEPKGSASYVCSELNKLVTKVKAVTQPKHQAVFPQLSAHPKVETLSAAAQVFRPKSVGGARVDPRVPLRQLYPARELNETGLRQRSSDPYWCGIDKQEKIQPDSSVPFIWGVLNYEVKVGEEEEMYACELCKMKFRDLDSLQAAHITVDNYFEIGPSHV